MLKILDNDFINEAHDKTVIEEGIEIGTVKGIRKSIERLAQSYRDTDPSLSAEESIRMAADLLDPEHIVSIEGMISDISAQENVSE